MNRKSRLPQTTPFRHKGELEVHITAEVVRPPEKRHAWRPLEFARRIVVFGSDFLNGRFQRVTGLERLNSEFQSHPVKRLWADLVRAGLDASNSLTQSFIRGVWSEIPFAQ
jgi:hypothetical protein